METHSESISNSRAKRRAPKHDQPTHLTTADVLRQHADVLDRSSLGEPIGGRVDPERVHELHVDPVVHEDRHEAVHDRQGEEQLEARSVSGTPKPQRHVFLPPPPASPPRLVGAGPPSAAGGAICGRARARRGIASRIDRARLIGSIDGVLGWQRKETEV